MIIEEDLTKPQNVFQKYARMSFLSVICTECSE